MVKTLFPASATKDSWRVIQSLHPGCLGVTPNWDVPTISPSAIPQLQPKKGTWNEVIAQTTRHLAVVCWLRSVAQGPESGTVKLYRQTIGCVVGIVFPRFIGFVFDLSLRLVVKVKRIEWLGRKNISHLISQRRLTGKCLFIVLKRKCQSPSCMSYFTALLMPQP